MNLGRWIVAGLLLLWLAMMLTGVWIAWPLLTGKLPAN